MRRMGSENLAKTLFSVAGEVGVEGVDLDWL